MKGTMIPSKDFKNWTPNDKFVVRQATTIATTAWGISLVMVDTSERAGEQGFSLSSSAEQCQRIYEDSTWGKPPTTLFYVFAQRFRCVHNYVREFPI